MEQTQTDILPQIEQHISWAVQIVKRVCLVKHLPMQNFEDYCQAGLLGLLEAHERFDPGKGMPFRQFAFRRVSGAVIDEVRSQSFLSKRGYRRKTEFFDDEISSVSKRSFVPGILAFREQYSEQVTEALVNEETPSSIYERSEEKRHLNTLLLKLPKTEYELLKDYYFHDITLSEVSRRCKTRSKATICRMHTRALTSLRECIVSY